MIRVLSRAALLSALNQLSAEDRATLIRGGAQAARTLMARHGCQRVLFLCGRALRPLGAAMAEALLQAGIETTLPEGADSALDLQGALIVDAGLGAEPAWAQGWMARVEAAGCPVLSLCIPAGVDPDTGCVAQKAFRASETLSLFGYLSGLFLHEGLNYGGELSVLLPGEGGEEDLARFDASDAARLLPPRRRTAHKGDSGRALLCVGSPQYVGAAVLSARACLAAGCGILYVACPDEVRRALYQVPEAISIPVGADWDDKSSALAAEALAGKQAAGIGCGLGGGDASVLLAAALKAKLPLALDADGLNGLSRHPALYPLLHEKVVLTPHPGEMSRLTGLPTEAILADPVHTAQTYARQWGTVVLLKGAATVVSDGRRTRIVAEGNAGLGKGGSGDVLTGIITGLLAQGVAPFEAACLGSYLLGTSAQRAFDLLKERMLNASDVIEALARQ